tara:strand:- start:1050 stop:1919 length:870 start_codon:yes stop_codon:yes gene_type:complete
MARPPEQLGSLRLVRQLGVGRKCQIWEASDESKSKRVAVKLVSPEFGSDKGIRQLLKHELTVSQSLEHSEIIHIDRYSTAGRLPHLVMELFRHPNLKMRLTSGAESIADQAPSIAQKSADAISHLHANRWVHRDLKPENILVDDSGNIRLIDLALASRPPGILAQLIPLKRTVQGSPSYMSPEQIRGSRVGYAGDIYSFGCLLYELVTGHPPFTGSTQQELLSKQLYATPPFASATNAGITPQLDRFIRELLAKRPKERPSSMAEVAAHLRNTPFLTPKARSAVSKKAD